jgi:hypothetical protein
MMKKTFLALVVVLLAPMLLVAVSSSAPYDPWSDLDENGKIDIFDLVKIAGAYATTGDPARNVTIAGYASKMGSSGQGIAPYGGYTFEVTGTEGFHAISVGIDPDYGVDVQIQWHVGGLTYTVDTYHVDGGTETLRRYDVQGDSLLVAVLNSGSSSNMVWLDWYLTA